MSWTSRPPPPLKPPPGRGRTILRPSPGGAAILSAAALPCPGRRPGQIPLFCLGPTTPPQRGGPAMSRQYRKCVTLSGPPPSVPVPSPTVPSSPAPSRCCRPLPASCHPCQLGPSRGIGTLSPPSSVTHRRGNPSPMSSTSPPTLAISSYDPSPSCTGWSPGGAP